MSVSFHEETSFRIQKSIPKSSGLIGLVQKTGLAKTPAEASVLLLGTAMVCIIAAISIFLLGRESYEDAPTNQNPIPAE